MNVRSRLLSPALGIEIEGLNTAEMSGRERQTVGDLFRQNRLVLMRGCDLDADRHVDLTSIIGPVSDADAIMKDGRKFTHISNQHADGRLPDGELLFHADHMFLKTPLRAISLYALAVPNVGGETCFIDMAKAYAELPGELKTSIDGLSARHVYDYDANRGDAAADDSHLSSNADQAIHPIVWTPPAGGPPVLFVSRLFTIEIIGLSKEDSDGLLGALFAYLDARPADYVHKWEVGDLIIWDNRVLQHARNDFSPDEKRALRRVPIGDRVAA